MNKYLNIANNIKAIYKETAYMFRDEQGLIVFFLQHIICISIDIIFSKSNVSLILRSVQR